MIDMRTEREVLRTEAMLGEQGAKKCLAGPQLFSASLQVF